MTLAVYMIACLLLGEALLRLRAIQHARRELRRLASGIAALRAPDISDEEKERRARAAALDSCSGAARLFARLAAVAAAAFLPVLLADLAGLVPAAELGRFAVRGDVMLGTAGVAGALLLAERRVLRALA